MRLLVLLLAAQGCAALTIPRRTVPEGPPDVRIEESLVEIYEGDTCWRERRETTTTVQRVRTEWGETRIGSAAFNAGKPAMGPGAVLSYELGVGGLMALAGGACLTGKNGLEECTSGKWDASAWALVGMGSLLLAGAVIDAVVLAAPDLSRDVHSSTRVTREPCLAR